MSYRVQFWKNPGRILKNYYEITPIWVLVTCDMAWMVFSATNAALNSTVHIYGKISPNEKRSLTNFSYQRKQLLGSGQEKQEQSITASPISVSIAFGSSGKLVRTVHVHQHYHPR